MQAEIINAIATSVIAFVTVIASAAGFYYNLTTIGLRLTYIIFFELMFLGAVWSFTLWIKNRGGVNA